MRELCMTNKTTYNSLKKRVLTILAEYEGWLGVHAIARRVDLPYDERGLYPYLRRLAAFGLVERAHDPWGRLFYRITPRGSQRLEFLKEKGR
jgi:DNA-binding PadR family transcriptional regulator